VISTSRLHAGRSDFRFRMRKSEKNTARKSLPSASQLPMIVPMKIWFRTGAEQGGEQSPQQHRSANPTSPKSPWPPQRPFPSDTPPTKNPADHSLRRGVGACAYFASPCSEHSRRGMSSWDCAPSNVSDQRRSLAHRRSVPVVALHRRMQFPDTSTRFCPKSRTCTKQTIKPCLPGARTAQCRARFSIAKLQSRNRHRLSTSHLLALTQEGPLAAVISNRELLVLENLQLIENKHRRHVLIENFEPNSSPSFRPFLPRGPKASRAAFPSVENPRNHFNPQGTV
jgi:hypothetical protein